MTPHTVLILGATGMLGHQLLLTLRRRFRLVAATRTGVAALRAAHPVFADVELVGGLDAEDRPRLRRLLVDVRPTAVVNCVGIIKQLPAAHDPVASITINALFPHLLARQCQEVGARLIHLSTDCVFSGTKGAPYTEDDRPDPPDLYGRSKLLGEVGGAGCVTLRTSIIGREWRTRHGLVEWFLGHRGGRVRGFDGALYSGITTPVLARTIGNLIDHHPGLEGVWQVAADPISKYELLCLLNDAFAAGVTIDRDTTFRCDRRLDGRRFQEATGFRSPPWVEMIQELAADQPLVAPQGGTS